MNSKINNIISFDFKFTIMIACIARPNITCYMANLLLIHKLLWTKSTYGIKYRVQHKFYPVGPVEMGILNINLY